MIYKISLIFILIFGLPVISLAQTENVKTALQNVADSLEQLSKLPPKNKDVSKELKIRVAAFKNILNLSAAELSDLTNKLIKVDNLDDGYLELRDQFLKDLGNQSNYYETIGGQLEGNINLVKIKQLAVQFKDWRNVVYHPILQKIVNFLLIFQGRDVLAIAQKRFNNIEADLKKVSDLEIIKNSPLNNWLDEADQHLQQATDLQKAASLVILKSTDSDIQKLVEDEFGNIKEAYNNFLQMSQWLKDASKKQP